MIKTLQNAWGIPEHRKRIMLCGRLMQRMTVNLSEEVLFTVLEVVGLLRQQVTVEMKV